MIDKGNGAREVLVDYFYNYTDHDKIHDEIDFFLAWLWERGFKVVPLDGNEDNRAGCEGRR